MSNTQSEFKAHKRQGRMKANTGQNRAPLKEVDFENTRLNPVGVELMTLAQLRTRATAQQLAQPERVSFHILFLVTHGTGMHTVDFVDHPLQAGSLLSVHPGQVHQWPSNPHIDGQLIIFVPAALHKSHAFKDWPTCSQLPSSLVVELLLAWQQLSDDLEEFHAHTLDMALIRQGLAYLLLRMVRWHASLNTAPSTAITTSHVYSLFIQALEKDFRHQRTVQTFCQKLGYSASTLSRACMTAQGHTAKAIIDQRVALEAQRLLAHTSDSINQIAHQLGFSEPTNFVKFFHRLVGSTPTAFRSELCSPKGN